jgi:hypothetical protein
MTDNLTSRLNELKTQQTQTEGISTGTTDNKLQYLRGFNALLETIAGDVDGAIIAACRLYLENNIGSSMPDFTGVTGCSTTLGSKTVAGANGRTYAAFDSTFLPENTYLTEAASPSNVNGLRSSLSTYFNGVKIYVKSNKPTFRLNDTDTRVFNTGAIVTLTDTTDIELKPSIEGDGQITLYICRDALAAGPQCSTYHSTYQGGGVHQIQWVGGSTTDPNGNVLGTNLVVKYGDYHNYTFRRSDAFPTKVFFVRYWPVGGGTEQTHGVGTGETWTCDIATSAISIDSVGTGGYDEFEAYICRP